MISSMKPLVVRFLSNLGAQHVNFLALIYMGAMDVEGSVNDHREHKESPSIRHCDNNNGTTTGNNISATFSRFFLQNALAKSQKSNWRKMGKAKKKFLSLLKTF
jgi:hypothetical protein